MIVDLLEWAAWITSAVLGVWMVWDMLKTGRAYDEEFLTTSVEGSDELFESHSTAGTAR